MESENQDACADLSGHDAGGLMNAALGMSAVPPMQMWEPPELEELSELLSGFEVREFLGRGGMGAVYRAYQESLERDVAIKILPPHLGEDPEFAERFRREARTMAKLSHPNIVHVYEFGRNETSGWFYLVMEFVDGADLASLIQSGAIAADEAVNYIGEICSALHHAHELGYVHRDVKPANVFLTKSGHIKVGDFGLAKLFSDLQQEALASGNLDLTMTGSAMGTMDYLAPEILRGGDVGADHRADIFSLGVMFYELLTGDRPRGWFAPPSKKIEVDVRVDGVVLRAMDESPERRYQSAGDVSKDLRDILSGKARLLEWAKVSALGLIGVSAAAGLVFMIWSSVSNRGENPIVVPQPSPAPLVVAPEPDPENGPIWEGDERMKSRVLTPVNEPITFEPFTLVRGIRNDSIMGVMGEKSLGIVLGIGEKLYYAYPHNAAYSKAEHWTLIEVSNSSGRGRNDITCFKDQPVISFSSGSADNAEHKCAIAATPFPISSSNWHITDIDEDPSIKGVTVRMIGNIEGVGIAYLDSQTHQIYFAWSEDPGVEDGSWTKSRVAKADQVGGSFDLAFLQGRPAVVYGRMYSINLAHALDKQGLSWPDASENKQIAKYGAKFGLSFYSDHEIAGAAFANRLERNFIFIQSSDASDSGLWEDAEIDEGTQYRPSTNRCGDYWVCSGWSQDDEQQNSISWIAVSADPKGRLGSWTVIPIAKGNSNISNVVVLGDTVVIPLWTHTNSRLRIAAATIPQLLELGQRRELLFKEIPKIEAN
ncbi:MAG: serine/threonine-protein kinase [Verrucomicrobiota bacterium]